LKKKIRPHINLKINLIGNGILDIKIIMQMTITGAVIANIG
jgi:hypothetical protein